MADKYYRISLNSAKTDLSENIILPPIRSKDSGKVIALAASMFSGKTDVKSVIIPEGITHIMDSAFAGCTGLIEITIPTSVQNMGVNVFNGCTNLTKIVVNKTSEEISTNPNWDNNWLGDVQGSKVVYIPTYTITFEGWENGTITTTNKNPSKAGEEIQLTVTENDGYKVNWVKYNGKTLNYPYKFIMPAKEVEITAEFVKEDESDIPTENLVAYTKQKVSAEDPVREAVAATLLDSNNLTDSGIFENNQYQIKLAAIRSEGTTPTVWLPYSIKNIDQDIRVYDTVNQIWIANSGWISNSQENINGTTYYSYTKQYLGTQIAALTYRFYKGE